MFLGEAPDARGDEGRLNGGAAGRIDDERNGGDVLATERLLKGVVHALQRQGRAQGRADANRAGKPHDGNDRRGGTQASREKAGEKRGGGHDRAEIGPQAYPGKWPEPERGSAQPPGQAIAQDGLSFRGELIAGGMEDEARQELKRGFRSLDALNDHARGGHAVSRIERRYPDIAKAVLHGGENGAKRLGAVNERAGSAQRHHGVEHLDPVLQIIGSEGVGLRFQKNGRRLDLAGFMERRIGEHVIEGAVRRPVGEIAAQTILHIALNHPQALGHAVALGVLLGQHRITHGDLDAGDVHVGNAGENAQRSHARADAGFHQRFAGARRYARRQKYGIDPGPVSLLRLENTQAAAEESILGQRRGDTARRLGLLGGVGGCDVHRFQSVRILADVG